ncbi:Conserved_hypothetical protein [Hexamita inflata]|uniref:RIIa domain-containing protein n=1 Tax=Hexamita inflata TaxID=28002 RepID=A0ABP1K192_9EUKA
MTDFPLIHDKNLPINRENLGLCPQTKPGDVTIQKGQVSDYKFDLARQQAIQKEEVQKQHTAYLEAHPELKQIVSDVLCSLMMDKPTDVYSYMAQYFKGVK